MCAVGDGRDALGHGERGAGADRLNAEAFGHRETVLDVLVLHVVVHVVAEHRDLDAGVVELLADVLPGGGVGGGAPGANLFLLRLPGGLLLRSEGGPAASAAAAGTGSAGEGFAVVGHEFRFAQSDFDIRADDGFRIGIGDAVEAVGDGADLHAVEFGIDPGGGAHAGERRGGQRQLSEISSGVEHD